MYYVHSVVCTSVCVVISTNTNLTKTDEDVCLGEGVHDLASVELVMYVCRSSFLYFPNSTRLFLCRGFSNSFCSLCFQRKKQKAGTEESLKSFHGPKYLASSGYPF